MLRKRSRLVLFLFLLFIPSALSATGTFVLRNFEPQIDSIELSTVGNTLFASIKISDDNGHETILEGGFVNAALIDISGGESAVTESLQASFLEGAGTEATYQISFDIDTERRYRVEVYVGDEVHVAEGSADYPDSIQDGLGITGLSVFNQDISELFIIGKLIRFLLGLF